MNRIGFDNSQYVKLSSPGRDIGLSSPGMLKISLRKRKNERKNQENHIRNFSLWIIWKAR